MGGVDIHRLSNLEMVGSRMRSACRSGNASSWNETGNISATITIKVDGSRHVSVSFASKPGFWHREPWLESA
jgi:hypothetical protein